MVKIWRIAVTEFVNATRSKAFLLGILALPVLIGLSIALQYFGQKNKDVRDRRFAVVDRTSALFPVIASKAAERNETSIMRGDDDGRREQTAPKFIPELFDEGPAGSAATELVLADRVRRKEITGYFLIATNALSPEAAGEGALAWSTEAHSYSELPDWLEQTVNEEIRRLRFADAGVDQALVHKLMGNVPVKRLGLSNVDAATGDVVKAKTTNRFATFALPGGCLFLLYLMVMGSAPALLNTVLEEKMQKISEVLLSSATPFQLMMGKVLGATLVSLTLSGLYLGTVAALMWRMGVLDLVPPSLVLWFVFFQLVSLLMFGSIFAAIGASCSEIRDAQNLMFPVMLLVMLPFFVFMPIMQSPNSPFATGMSLFPPATPMLMMLRIAIPPGPPWWEIALGVGLTTLFTLACVWAGAKIFRIGILAQGQAPTLGKLVRWVLSK